MALSHLQLTLSAVLLAHLAKLWLCRSNSVQAVFLVPLQRGSTIKWCQVLFDPFVQGSPCSGSHPVSMSRFLEKQGVQP